jgi:hypothetical protein
MGRGQWLVIGMLGVGMLAAGFAWWYHRTLTDEALAFWGGQVAAAIAHPDRFEVWNLAPPGNPDAEALDAVVVDGVRWPIVTRRDITQAPGVTHARQALLEDASFAFDASTLESDPPRWTHALSLVREDVQVTLLLDLDQARLRFLEAGRETIMAPRLQNGLKKFLEEQFRQPAAGEAARE